MPDIETYLRALDARVTGHALEGIRFASPFFLRTVEPSIEQARGRKVTEVRRLGKRIVLRFNGDFFLVLHLMISGRLHWKAKGVRLARGKDLAAFDFDNGTLTVTEASSTKRASLHFLQGEENLRVMDRGGLEVLTCTLAEFSGALTCENHTLKRTLTDPRLFSGIGNAYSDEILHRAKLPPLALSQGLRDEQIERLFAATREILVEWTERLKEEAGADFPEGVTAFRPEMAVHGKFKKPCPVCGTAIQRIRYKDNETNYCPRCQTDGKIYADRSLSKLLKEDWPSSIEELENTPAIQGSIKR